MFSLQKETHSISVSFQKKSAIEFRMETESIVVHDRNRNYQCIQRKQRSFLCPTEMKIIVISSKTTNKFYSLHSKRNFLNACLTKSKNEKI